MDSVTELKKSFLTRIVEDLWKDILKGKTQHLTAHVRQQLSKEGYPVRFLVLLAGSRALLSNCCDKFVQFTFELNREVRAECTDIDCRRKLLQRAQINPEVALTIFQINPTMVPEDNKVRLLLSKVEKD